MKLKMKLKSQDVFLRSEIFAYNGMPVFYNDAASVRLLIWTLDKSRLMTSATATPNSVGQFSLETFHKRNSASRCDIFSAPFLIQLESHGHRAHDYVYDSWWAYNDLPNDVSEHYTYVKVCTERNIVSALCTRPTRPTRPTMISVLNY